MTQNQGFVISRGNGNWKIDDYADGKFVARLAGALAYIAKNVIPGSANADITEAQPVALALTRRNDLAELLVFLIDRETYIAPRRYNALLGGTIAALGGVGIAAGTMAYFNAAQMVEDIHFAAGGLVVGLPALAIALRNRFRKE